MTTQEPLTVIIPARNAETTVRLAVRSTLRDLSGDDRVIVLDDGSDDGTGDVLESIDHRQLAVWHNTRPRGVSAGLNRLLAGVTTPLVARMDADDIVIPGRFRHQRAHLLRRGLDVTFGSVVNFGTTVSSFAPGTVRNFGPREVAVLHAIQNVTAHPTMLARTESLTTVGGYRNSPAEDLDLWFRLHASDALLAVSARPLLLYRRHTQQVTGQQVWRDRLSTDPLLEESHTALMRHLGWPGPSCWTLVAGPVRKPPTAELEELRDFLVDLAAGVSTKCARFMQREFARRGSSLGRARSDRSAVHLTDPLRPPNEQDHPVHRRGEARDC